MVKGTKKIMEKNEISKKEFWLGIAIITFAIGLWNLIEPFPIRSSIEVELRTTRVHEVINCITDNDGVVECHE